MDNHPRRLGRTRAVFASCLVVGLLAGACTTSRVKTAVGPATKVIATTAVPSSAVSPTSVPPTTDSPASDPSDPTTTGAAVTEVTVPAATAVPVTAAKRWVIVAEFPGSGEKEGNTFTMTGAPARVTYKASGLFLLNIDTGDPADDTTIGSCPAAGCTQQGAVHVVPGGWYLHVTSTPPATVYTVTLEEYQ